MATHLNINREGVEWLQNPEPETMQKSRKSFTEGLPGRQTLNVARASSLLIVDNQELDPRGIGCVLGKLGFDIVPAKSGAQALEHLMARRFDLVLIDLSNPDADGFQLCRMIHQNPAWAGIPVIIHSLRQDKNLTAKAFESGAMDCMTSSFNQPELISRVRAQLSHKIDRDNLKKLAEDKEESLGILMHQLKNHLVGMNMTADVLCDGDRLFRDPGLGLMLEDISRSSGQMLSFVNLFLANAATDHQLVIKLEPVCLSEAASRSVQQFQEAARRKELVVHASLPAENALVQADPNALNQVLDNLLSNAVKFSPSGKQISVIVRPTATHVECQVQDQGNGFTPEDKSRMFRRYGRLSARPTGGESSAGLGLSIVKRLMDAMSGELACESAAGSGARFSIRLPRAAAQSELRLSM
jgi:two-component system, sensor histidine kinase and response regulator